RDFHVTGVQTCALPISLWNELQLDGGPAYAATIETLRTPLQGKTTIPEESARRFVESLALALQASVLLRAASLIAQPFVRSRLRSEERRVGKDGGCRAR